MSGNRLAKKNIIIIGGTTGMGLSTALACINEGAKIIVVGKQELPAQQAVVLLKENGKVVLGDATDEQTAERAIQTCLENFGDVHGLYHVAGGSGRKSGDGPLHEITLEGWQYTLQLNLTSLMLSNRAAVKYFLEQKNGGSIVNMGSVLGYSPSPKYFTTHAYAAAKSAIIGFSKSIAAYYAPHNIRINVIAPSLIETPMSQRAVGDDEIINFLHSKQPLDGGRVGTPEDVDGAAVFLLSDESKFITGQVLAVDGGWTVSEGQYKS